VVGIETSVADNPVRRPRTLLYTDIVTTCYIVLFRISKRNPDPFGRISPGLPLPFFAQRANNDKRRV
jgi:hypothetical protein